MLHNVIFQSLRKALIRLAGQTTAFCLLFGVFAGKKLAPTPPKAPYCQTGAMSDQSTGQPSPVSLSPTPPSTPSPYGFGYPQGYATISSPGQVAQMATTPSLSSPPSLAGTLTKVRPVPKPPRQRPNLPPPQPPTTPGTSPQPLDHSTGLLDGLSPGESMSTGKVSKTSQAITGYLKDWLESGI